MIDDELNPKKSSLQYCTFSSTAMSRRSLPLNKFIQEPVLFDRSLADNIKYGDNSREVSMEEVSQPLCTICILFIS